jgi:hypothetical protein
MKREIDHETLLSIIAILIVCWIVYFIISVWLLFNNDDYKTVDFSTRTDKRTIKDESITKDKYNFRMYGYPYADSIYRDKETNETGI